MERQFHCLRVGYVYVPTTDIDASIAWYTEHLDFKLVEKFEDRGSYLGVLHSPHKNAIAVVLIETTDEQPLQIMRNGKPFPILALLCPDIEAAHRSLASRGVAVEELHTLGAGEAKYFYFRDNQGNLLEGTWSIWDPQDELKEDF